MSDFFRFPHTPHLKWLGEGTPRDDKVLSDSDAAVLLSGDVLVEEKLDGANLGISRASDGSLRLQNRGQYLQKPLRGQFTRLASWLALHEQSLKYVLNDSLILFGEWCAARHSLDYSSLPDWFLLFDVYDRDTGVFWSSDRRNSLATEVGLQTVPMLAKGRYTVLMLEHLLMQASSRYRDGTPEGIIVRRESELYCDLRAKLVRSDFTQAIKGHWRNKNIEWNYIAGDKR